MSGEIVVGACYRDPKDGEVVRVLERASVRSYNWWTCCVVNPSPVTSEEAGTRFEMHGSELLTVWERVPDPTPAVIDDAEPLAGEMTLRQVEAWRVRRGIDDVHGEIGLMYTGRTRLWHAWAERDGEVLAKTSSSDPQDAITALMARVGP